MYATPLNKLADCMAPRCRRPRPMASTKIIDSATYPLPGRGKGKTPEKTRRPATSSGMFPTCENTGLTSPGIEPVLPWLDRGGGGGGGEYFSFRKSVFMRSCLSKLSRGRGGVVVRLLASVGSPPDFRNMVIVPDGVAGRWVISGVSRFPRPCIPALLHTHIDLTLSLTSSALKSSIRAVQISSLTQNFLLAGRVMKLLLPGSSPGLAVKNKVAKRVWRSRGCGGGESISDATSNLHGRSPGTASALFYGPKAGIRSVLPRYNSTLMSKTMFSSSLFGPFTVVYAFTRYSTGFLCKTCTPRHSEVLRLLHIEAFTLVPHHGSSEISPCHLSKSSSLLPILVANSPDVGQQDQFTYPTEVIRYLPKTNWAPVQNVCSVVVTPLESRRATSCGYNSSHPVWHALYECLQDIHGDSSPFLLQPFHELSNGFWPRLMSPHPAIQIVPKMFYRLRWRLWVGQSNRRTLLSAYHCINSRRPVASSCAFPTREDKGVTPQGIEPGSAWWDAAVISAKPAVTPLTPRMDLPSGLSIHIPGQWLSISLIPQTSLPLVMHFGRHSSLCRLVTSLVFVHLSFEVTQSSRFSILETPAWRSIANKIVSLVPSRRFSAPRVMLREARTVTRIFFEDNLRNSIHPWSEAHKITIGLFRRHPFVNLHVDLGLSLAWLPHIHSLSQVELRYLTTIWRLESEVLMLLKSFSRRRQPVEALDSVALVRGGFGGGQSFTARAQRSFHLAVAGATEEVAL
ncbi:hypothetical protein PR048_019722 [Dryococelus australis]|uniref:Uncharacterized protein n=1 Tax=Dryococelus australis TaxID=614101 RepID=A0ABQ9H4A8_9NEOP|nr:hypothetical protein PR048_019722 [Dryococelus australis]